MPSDDELHDPYEPDQSDHDMLPVGSGVLDAGCSVRYPHRVWPTIPESEATAMYDKALSAYAWRWSAGANGDTWQVYHAGTYDALDFDNENEAIEAAYYLNTGEVARFAGFEEDR